MNKIYRVVLTAVCLLTVLGADAYKIIRLDKVGGDGDCVLKAFLGSFSSEITVNVTDIPKSTDNSDTWIYLTVTPSNGYYLKSLTWEPVTDLGNAESRTRVGVESVHNITINNNYQGHFGNSGNEYHFQMPANDVIVTATFAACTSITDLVITFEDESTSKEYDGANHTVVVKKGGSPLQINHDYYTNYPTIKNAGSYVPEITGYGIYYGTFNATTLTITKPTLTITAEDKSKDYLAPLPTFTFSYSGFVSNETQSVLTTLPIATTSATSESAKGTYTITPSGAVAANYNLSYVNGTLTINPKALSTPTVTLDHTFFNYDSNNSQKATITKIEDGTVDIPVSNYDFVYQATGNYGSTNYQDPDIYYIDITFKENYSGTFTVPYQIRKQITLNSGNKWMTWYEPDYNLYVPDNDVFEVYIVRTITNSGIGLDKKNYIRKGTPMLLYRKGNDISYYPEIYKKIEGGEAEPTVLSEIRTHTNSAFKGVNAATDVAMLPTETNNEIWILVDDQFIRTFSGTIPAGKCYLELPKSDFSAPSLSLSRKTTGINNVEYRDTKDDTIYDLSGRKVSNPNKGIYIQNGKKIIIR